MSYRYVKYNIPEKVHPWKMWVNGYKYFREHFEHLYQRNISLETNPKLFTMDKYRLMFQSQSDFIVNTEQNHLKTISLPNNIMEHDSTALSVIKIDNVDNDMKITILWNCQDVFKDMDQDTRLQYVNGNIIMTYNGFIRQEDDLLVKMFYRNIYHYKNNDNNILYIGQEKDLLANIPHRPVEKNCVYDENGTILYSINGSFKYQPNINSKELICHNIEPLQKIINYYSKQNVIFSLSTPAIKFQGNNLFIGHVKIVYKNELFNKFFTNVSFKNIKMHGKYIYYMFFVLYDDSYQVLKISNAFIPTVNDCHLPYLLVFPSGLTFNKYIYITYGEGDVKCKILRLEPEQVNDLLIPIDDITVDNYTFGFYDPSIINDTSETKIIKPSKQNKILVFGYYGHKNTGDDGFVVVLKWLRQKYYPNDKWEFANSYTELDVKTYDIVIIGGGDVIADYFMNKIKTIKESFPNKKIIAISVGIPYMNCFERYAKYIDQIYLRNIDDYHNLSKSYPQLHYCPDLCFFLPDVYINKIITKPKNEYFNIGVFLARPYYHIQHEKEYFDFVKSLSECFNRLLSKTINSKKVFIHLIPFGINIHNSKENDHLINNHVYNFINKSNIETNIINYVFDKIDNLQNVREIYTLMKTMDYNICSRFHAHIFSIIHNTPFTSLTTTRKCRELMKNINLTENHYQIPTDNFDKLLPLNSVHIDEIYHLIMTNISNSDNIKNKLNEYYSKILIDKELFIKSFEKNYFNSY
jgi:hypothetical protein